MPLLVRSLVCLFQTDTNNICWLYKSRTGEVRNLPGKISTGLGFSGSGFTGSVTEECNIQVRTLREPYFKKTAYKALCMSSKDRWLYSKYRQSKQKIVNKPARVRTNTGEMNLDKPEAEAVTALLGFDPENFITIQFWLVSYWNDFPHIVLHSPFPSLYT